MPETKNEKDLSLELMMSAATKLREAATELELLARHHWGKNTNLARRVCHLAESYRWQARALQAEASNE
jgi:hypothetical protein